MGTMEVEQAEELRRKLRALDGDRKASRETAGAKIDANKQKIQTFREQNKSLVASLRALKNPGKQKFGAGVSVKGCNIMDNKVCNLIKKHNQVRAEASRKEEKLIVLQKELYTVGLEEHVLKSNQEGTGPDAARLRELENKLDKAKIKRHEANHIGKTYKKIIQRLMDDRLEFDNKLVELEQTLSSRRDELVRLEMLCSDAATARDGAKGALANAEKRAAEDRATREAERKELQTLADEQRRKYEAMEARQELMKRAELTRSSAEAGEDAGVQNKLSTAEDMMRKIQEATGVMDVHEVLDRFRSQTETEAKLVSSKEENTKDLSELQDSLATKQREYEALKYSGEERNTSNQRMVSEFEQYLTAERAKSAQAEKVVKRNVQLLVQVKAGIDHLHDKLETLKPVQFRAAAVTMDKLEESKKRLCALIVELEQRHGEMEAAAGDEVPLVLPANNTRIKIETKEEDKKKKEEDDDDPDMDAISRDEVKRAAQLIVDANNVDPRMAAAKKKKGGRR